MSVTPAFKDRGSEFLKDLPVGTRVRGDWGAMFANNYGDVLEYNAERKLHLIGWDHCEPEEMGWYEVRATRSVNGSPIGVWIDG